MTNNKVFIPALPTRYDAATQQRVPTLDLNAAERYGQLVAMCEGPVKEWPTAVATVKARCLELGPSDHLLAVGDVVLVAVAIAEVCRVHGRCSVLRWDRHLRTYDQLEVRI